MMPAGVHRMGSAAYQRHLRAVRALLGKCRMCSKPAKRGYKTCIAHLRYNAAWKAAKRRAA